MSIRLFLCVVIYFVMNKSVSCFLSVMFRAPGFCFVFSRQRTRGPASAPHTHTHCTITDCGHPTAFSHQARAPRICLFIFVSNQVHNSWCSSLFWYASNWFQNRKILNDQHPQKPDERGLIMAQSLPLDLLTFNLTQEIEIKKITCDDWQIKKRVLPLLCWMCRMFMTSTALSLPRTCSWCGQLVIIALCSIFFKLFWMIKHAHISVECGFLYVHSATTLKLDVSLFSNCSENRYTCVMLPIGFPGWWESW